MGSVGALRGEDRDVVAQAVLQGLQSAEQMGAEPVELARAGARRGEAAEALVDRLARRSTRPSV